MKTKSQPPVDQPTFRSEAARVKFEWEDSVQENGAHVHLAKPSTVKGWIVVLAQFRNEWVVWNMCEATQEFQSGKYFQSYDDALKIFKKAS